MGTTKRAANSNSIMASPVGVVVIAGNLAVLLFPSAVGFVGIDVHWTFGGRSLDTVINMWLQCLNVDDGQSLCISLNLADVNIDRIIISLGPTDCLIHDYGGRLHTEHNIQLIGIEEGHCCVDRGEMCCEFARDKNLMIGYLTAIHSE